MTSRKRSPQQLYQSAMQHYEAGNVQAAAVLAREIIARLPENADANHLLGFIEHELGHNDAAYRLIAKAIRLNPNHSEYYNNLSVILREQGKIEEAVSACRRALTIKPDNFKARVNLGNYLAVRGEPAAAAESYRRAIALRPDNAEVYRNLGNVLLDQASLSEAIACYRKALALDPGLANAHNNLGNALCVQGDLPGALASFRAALARKPDYAIAHTNILLAMNYDTGISQEEILAESLRWDEEQARIFMPAETVHDNNLLPQRRLRIGYVSPDFRDHSVASFFEPVLTAHDRRAFAVYCYANVMRPDAVTGRMQAAADHWCPIAGMSDAEAAARIRQDKIDILVDLAGHTAKNRLLLFARKPAPVQVTWLGYPNTTGMRAMDYRITDATADPVGAADKLHSEKLVRLPHGFLCYQADGCAPPVSEPPCLAQGAVTFGSFNNLSKTGPAVVGLWSEILQAMPDSRLVLKSVQLADQATRKHYLALFAAEGIAPGRVELFGKLPSKRDHLGLYRRVDIGLDPFPYNGTTTTCEALWMGVPVVTLRGSRHAGRVGASVMQRVGLDDLVAPSAAEYARIALALAGDRKRLQELRAGMRARLQGSELMDRRLFTTDLEQAFRRMWLDWLRDRA